MPENEFDVAIIGSGTGATDLIGKGVLALTHEETGESLVNTIHAHQRCMKPSRRRRMASSRGRFIFD